jgi:hypothetical protein
MVENDNFDKRAAYLMRMLEYILIAPRGVLSENKGDLRNLEGVYCYRTDLAHYVLSTLFEARKYRSPVSA